MLVTKREFSADLYLVSIAIIFFIMLVVYILVAYSDEFFAVSIFKEHHFSVY